MYLLNGNYFDVNATHTLMLNGQEVTAPPGFFNDADQRAALGLVYAADPDPSLYYLGVDSNGNENWIAYTQAELDAIAAQKIITTRSDAVSRIENGYASAISVISDQYPETERISWTKQEAEARAYTADANAPVPLLTAMSTARGMSIATLASRIIVNADAYVVYAGACIGRRQKGLDMVAAAGDNVDALNSVGW